MRWLPKCDRNSQAAGETWSSKLAVFGSKDGACMPHSPPDDAGLPAAKPNNAYDYSSVGKLGSEQRLRGKGYDPSQGNVHNL